MERNITKFNYVIMLLISISLVLTLKIITLQSRLSTLEKDTATIEDTQKQLNKANYTISMLQNNYENLINDYDNLDQSYDNLKLNYLDLRNDYIELENNYNEIKDNIIGYTETTHKKLTKYSGVNYYNQHKETYYNLPMNKVVSIAQNKGYEGKYWVRKDGAKMFGTYIIVAADQSKYPYGTIVDTSLGKGIVLDTGSFIYTNSNQFDIATTW